MAILLELRHCFLVFEAEAIPSVLFALVFVVKYLSAGSVFKLSTHEFSCLFVRPYSVKSLLVLIVIVF